MKELDELKQEYQQGKLKHLETELEEFIKKHETEIKRFTEYFNTQLYHKINIDTGLRWYLTLQKSFNLKNEMNEQLEEIKKEIWYRKQEKIELKPDDIAKNWVLKHSAGWRDHRVLQIVYVYLQDKEKYLKLFTEL